MARMERFTVDLPAETIADVERAVESGLYSSASEVLQAGIDALHIGDDTPHEGPEFEAWLRKEVVPTYDRIKAGKERLIPIDEVFAELKARHEADRET
ncbi:type II toxin-antitoxin system ParD family antitoxin [Mesorhizobium sp. CAU 1732]|uniref:ribbon-helix-helix domain-containing protein n=1 Tax=Mesorhizobium sp. CAU 1732 TaxID=3140358 RepID=UPI00326132C2